MDSPTVFAAEMMRVPSIRSAQDLRRYQYLQELWPAVSAGELARYHDTFIGPALARATGCKSAKRIRRRAISDLRAKLEQQKEHELTKREGASPPAARPRTATGQPPGLAEGGARRENRGPRTALSRALDPRSATPTRQRQVPGKLPKP